MAELDTQVIYRELLVLSEQLSRVEKQMADNLKILRDTNEELRKGRTRIEEAKKRYGFASDSADRRERSCL